MKRPVLLIGSSGFIGKHLVPDLQKDFEIYQINRRADEHFPEDHYLSVDLLDSSASQEIQKWSSGKSFSAIIYLTNINSRTLPGHLTAEQANLLALSNFLNNFSGEAEAFGLFSSVYIYKNPEVGNRINEASPIESSSQYGSLKIRLEERVTQWCSSLNIPLSIFRPEWVYGRFEQTRKLIPELCRAAIALEPYTVKINPREVRQPIYISDIVQAIHHWLDYPPTQPVEILLLAGPEPVNQMDLFEIVQTQADYQGNPVPDYMEQDNKSLLYSFDTSATQARLHWQPEISPKDGLLKVISFLRAARFAQEQNNRLWLFFDLDGTLLDIEDRFFSLHCDGLTELGREPLSRGDYWTRKQSGVREEGIIQVSGNSDVFDQYESNRVNRIESAKYLAMDRVWPGVEAELIQLKEAAELAIITLRKNEPNLMEQVRHLKLDQIFPTILCSGPDQPDLAGYEIKVEMVRRQFGNRHFYGWFIGDTETDIKAGKALGMKTCVVCFGLRSRQLLETCQPDVIIDTPAEFVDFLAGLTDGFKTPGK